MMENIGGILSSNSITRYLKNEKIRGKNVMATLEKYYICSHNNILVSQNMIKTNFFFLANGFVIKYKIK